MVWKQKVNPASIFIKFNPILLLSHLKYLRIGYHYRNLSVYLSVLISNYEKQTSRIGVTNNNENIRCGLQAR